MKIGGLALVGSLMGEYTFAQNMFMSNLSKDVRLLKLLVTNNDDSVAEILQNGSFHLDIRLTSFRRLANNISVLSASVSNRDSTYYRSSILVEKLCSYINILLKGQYDDGTLDSGGNRQSPPDTAFVLEHLCSAMKVLINDEHTELRVVRSNLKTFILKASEAMVTGGVHTPNHRWVVCAALANINSLYPNTRYIKRIEEWLAEGIYQNEDGHYLERSANYSVVINRAFITIARLLDRPELLDYVVKNLITFCYYTELNGNVVSIDSRRQDQIKPINVTKFYLEYRYMAIITNNSLLVDMTNQIEKLPDFKTEILSHSLIEFMVNRDLEKELPTSNKAIGNFEKLFSTSNLARIKKGNRYITIFGGNDRPIEVISGKSSNPNFLTYRKGKAILEHMRLSTSFFRMGYFRSEGLIKRDQVYKLHETKEAYYYQPLAAQNHIADGDYKLSASEDGRFWNKMSFDLRAKSNIKKQVSTIDIIENDGVLEIDFKVDGPPNVEVTIELCFRKGGEFVGTLPIASDDNILKKGYGEYKVDNDTIKFGPGIFEHQRTSRLESEKYGYHGGSLRAEGEHVFFTGFTPFNYKMTIG
ncbi:hypothetical protein B0O79_3468 [Flavobacteriaceae bacterium MAR_2009_75]|nr:hypothetical protein B0O79_3468 [Flavobacteriaceae bacterium MAR_2009_75]